MCKKIIFGAIITIVVALVIIFIRLNNSIVGIESIRLLNTQVENSTIRANIGLISSGKYYIKKYDYKFENGVLTIKFYATAFKFCAPKIAINSIYIENISDAVKIETENKDGSFTTIWEKGTT